MEQQVQNFFPVFVYLAAVVGFALTTLGMTHLPFIKPWKNTAVKSMPYESGMDPVGDARQHFDVKFYLIAIMFLVFDVELLFLYPWAVAAYAEDRAAFPSRCGTIVFGSMIAFSGPGGHRLHLRLAKGVFQWR